MSNTQFQTPPSRAVLFEIRPGHTLNLRNMGFARMQLTLVLLRDPRCTQQTAAILADALRQVGRVEEDSHITAAAEEIRAITHIFPEAA